MTTRTALVGGGSSGIGRATAQALAADGHRVAITGRDVAALTLTAKELSVDGAEIEPVAADLADIASPKAVIDQVERSWGGIDVLVINAGGPPPGRVLEVSEDDWQAATQLLLLGPIRLARLALPGMANRGFGRIVLVTSTAVRQPQPGLALSTVLRAAATSAAKLISLEYADRGVTVNCVAPGATDTPRRREVLAARGDAEGLADNASIPAGRPALADEIADVIAFLASDRSSYINGTVVTVDGGRTETP